MNNRDCKSVNREEKVTKLFQYLIETKYCNSVKYKLTAITLVGKAQIHFF